MVLFNDSRHIYFYEHWCIHADKLEDWEIGDPVLPLAPILSDFVTETKSIQLSVQ